MKKERTSFFPPLASGSGALLAAQKIVQRALLSGAKTKEDLIRIKKSVLRSYKENTLADSTLLSEALALQKAGMINAPPDFFTLFQKRKIRTLSGIAPLSVLMPPAPCSSACVYCPSERADAFGKTLFQKDTEKKYGPQKVPSRFQKPGVLVMPKSYLSSEPGAMRALLAGFDPFVQITRRLRALEKAGHKTEKCELIVQGGTFSDVPKRTRNAFIKRCFQACNGHKGRISLKKAQEENEKALHRIVGLTLETRPGCVTPAEIRAFRDLGATRIELGVQILDDDITRKTRRLQTRAEVENATRLLRDAGMKICYHLMPGLPFSSPEKDRETYREIFTNPAFCPDLVKIYPCSVVPFSPLAKWYEEGKYTPYSPEVLFSLLREMLLTTPRWVRISRLIRDIPGTAILGGSKLTNLRQILEEDIRKKGEKLEEIRSREIRNEQEQSDSPLLFSRTEYRAGEGQELFLEWKNAEDRLYALLRLRLPDAQQKKHSSGISALQGAALIRELHTFGAALGLKESRSASPQHSGLGKSLLERAEDIARSAGYKKIAVISGIGVKPFYRRQGYDDAGTYLLKDLNSGSAAKKK